MCIFPSSTFIYSLHPIQNAIDSLHKLHSRDSILISFSIIILPTMIYTNSNFALYLLLLHDRGYKDLWESDIKLLIKNYLIWSLKSLTSDRAIPLKEHILKVLASCKTGSFCSSCHGLGTKRKHKIYVLYSLLYFWVEKPFPLFLSFKVHRGFTFGIQCSFAIRFWWIFFIVL